MLREIVPPDTALAFTAMRELRTALTDRGKFVEQVDSLQRPQGYRLVGMLPDEGADAVAVVGFRLATSLSWGLHVYVDDLSTVPSARGRGHAGQLLAWVHDEAGIAVPTPSACCQSLLQRAARPIGAPSGPRRSGGDGSGANAATGSRSQAVTRSPAASPGPSSNTANALAGVNEVSRWAPWRGEGRMEACSPSPSMRTDEGTKWTLPSALRT